MGRPTGSKCTIKCLWFDHVVVGPFTIQLLGAILHSTGKTQSCTKAMTGGTEVIVFIAFMKNQTYIAFVTLEMVR